MGDEVRYPVERVEHCLTFWGPEYTKSRGSCTSGRHGWAGQATRPMEALVLAMRASSWAGRETGRGSRLGPQPVYDYALILCAGTPAH